MVSNAQFRITEYATHAVGEPEQIRSVYQSLPMCLRDASRFAAALSYARGAFVQVIPAQSDETYREWWYAGTITKQADIPPIRGGA